MENNDFINMLLNTKKLELENYRVERRISLAECDVKIEMTRKLVHGLENQIEENKRKGVIK